MIAAFYGGELVWRERDRKINELIDSTPVPELGDDGSEDPRDLRRPAGRQSSRHADRHRSTSWSRARGASGIPQYVGWFILPAAINGLLIAILAVFFQVLSPNKYVGWGLLFVWFVAGIFLSNMGYGEPALQLRRARRNVPLSDFVGAGSFWWGEAVMLFYWLCFAIILVVIAHLLWPRGTDLALRSRLGRMPRLAERAGDCDRRRSPLLAMAAHRRLRLLQYQGPQPLSDQRRAGEVQRRLRAQVSEVREAAAARRSPR